MLRIEIEEQRIADGERALRCSRAVGHETQDRVGAVTVLIDEMGGWNEAARAVASFDPQAGDGVGRDSVLTCPQLTPGDRAIIVAVEADGMIEIPQSNVPLPFGDIVLDRDFQVAVARLVGESRCRRAAQQSERQRTTSVAGSYRSLPSAVTKRPQRDVLKLMLFQPDEDGLGAFGAPAASAASSTIRASAGSR